MSTADECRERLHKEALEFLAGTGQDLFTECAEGHPQLECSKCDGVHCYRACDEVQRTECRRTWKITVRQ